MIGKPKSCIALILALLFIPLGMVGSAAERKYANYTLLTEEEKAEEAEPTDELYKYNLKYKNGTAGRLTVNLYYLDRLEDTVPINSGKLNIIQSEGNTAGQISLSCDGTQLRSYTIDDNLSGFLAIQNYKLFITPDSKGGASILLADESEINDISKSNETTVDAQKYAVVSNVTVTTDLTFTKGASALYYLQAEEAGYYLFTAVKSVSNLAYLDFLVNGDKAEYDVNASQAVIWLEKGMNTFELKCTRGSSAISAIKFKPFYCSYSFDSTANFVYVSGNTVPGADVSMVLASGDGEIAVEDIANIVQVTADENGEYSGEFVFTDILSDKRLVVNAGGTRYEIDAPVIYESGENASARLSAVRQGNAVKTTAELNNTFRGNNEEWHIIVAFYDSNNRLISVDTSGNFAEIFETDIPEGAQYANSFLWKSLNNSTPLATEIQTSTVNE